MIINTPVQRKFHQLRVSMMDSTSIAKRRAVLASAMTQYYTLFNLISKRACFRLSWVFALPLGTFQSPDNKTLTLRHGTARNTDDVAHLYVA